MVNYTEKLETIAKKRTLHKIAQQKGGVLPNFPHLAVALHHQENGWSCGPASLMIAMSHFGPVGITEEVLRKEARTKWGVGTTRYWLEVVARKHGFSVKSNDNGTIEEVREMLKNNWPVIVMYKDSPTSFHYSVAVAAPLYGGNIVLADPWKEAFVNWQLPKFLAAWITPVDNNHWWMAIKPKDQAEKEKKGHTPSQWWMAV